MRITYFLGLVLLFIAQATGQIGPPTKTHVNGVELHYIELGQGDPVILIHGGQGDYRSWEPQMRVLSQHYRVIAYSRRYNYPNNNPLTGDYSPYTDADDLAALIRKLKLGRVHLVGTSAGAFTALVLAIKYPGKVRSLILAEPPIHQWVRVTPEGEAEYDKFMSTIQLPAKMAFARGDEKGAMKIFVDGFAGTGRFDLLTPDAQAVVMQNARFFKAISISSNPYPNLSREKVGRLRIPILIVTGANTIAIHRLVNDELGRALPKAERVTIPMAGHGSPRENPQAFNDAMIGFLAEVHP